ncbi:MAG TPA: BTAD domain-containing putative transcriptional regulator [Actinomycetota bacterium]|nr:BTAD domain-containing putative transcriptional regulator [Actinomycetota bacterium]
MAERLDVRILGPLAVERDGVALPLGGQKQRALLAALLLREGEVLPTELLIELLWGDSPPPTARTTIQVYISKFRKLLGTGTGLSIETRGSGYVARVDPQCFDVRRFEQLVEEGRSAQASGDALRAHNLLSQALALWRGAPLEDLDLPAELSAAVSRLEEARVGALAARIETELALGRHAEVVPELEQLLADQPLNERLHTLAMLALYRAGRQADALDVAERLRRRLAEDLGIEPSPTVRKLAEDILRQSPDLDLPQGVSPEAAPRQVRASVTVLSCRLPEEHEAGEDPEARLRITERRLQGALQVIASCGGAVHEAIGRRLIAVFGVPASHEDDAARALVAANRLQTLPGEADLSPEGAPRIGVATGEVLVEEAGERRTLLSADPLELAEELVRSARPGEVLLDALTLRLAGPGVGSKPADVKLPPGTPPTEVHRLTAAPPGGRHLRDVGFVGRAEELELLRQAFDRVARRSSPALVTLLGPAGIGKSRLLSEFVTSLGEAARVLTGRCLPFGTDITLWPIAEVIRQAAGAGPADPADTLRDRIAGLLGDEVDAAFIGEQIAGALGISDVPPVPDEIAWAIRKLLEALAGARPLIVVVDDLHWGDATLLDLIEHIATWARDAPLMLVCLARPELLERRPGWGGGRFDALTLSLDPLGEAEATLLLANLLPGGTVTDAARELILDAAEGNPLFLEELVAMLIENGTLRWRDGTWVLALGTESVPVPITVQALIRARLDRASPLERRVLELGAVVGREFGEEDLLELSDEEEAGGLPHALQRLVGRDLIVPVDGGRPGRAATYRFRHLLIRDVVYRSAAKQRRAEDHERFGEVLERRAGERLPELEDLIGSHLEAAWRLRREIGSDGYDDLRRRAARHLAAAGRRSFARSDMAAAASQLGRALELLDPEDPSAPDLAWRLAVALYETGELGRADEVLADGTALAERLGDEPAAWRLRLERADLRLWREPEATDAREVIDLAREAVERLRSLGDEAGVARAYRLMGDALNRLGRQEEALEAFEEGARHAGAAGDERELEERRGIGVTLGPMPVDQAIELVRGIVEGARRPNVEALGQLGLLHGMAGEMDEARRLLDEALGRAREQGVEWKAAAIAIGYASTLLLAEEIEEAEQHARWAVERLQDMGERSLMSSAAALLGEILYRCGRLDEALLLTTVSESASAPDDVASQVAWRGVRAKVLASTGRLEDAEQLGREAVALGEGTDYLNMRGEAHLDLAEVLMAVGRGAEAVEELDRALLLFERKGNRAAAGRARRLRDAAVGTRGVR